MDNYTLIHTETERYVVGQFLKDVVKRLPETDFFRVHRSHVLRIHNITSIDGNIAFIQDRGIPISKQFRTAFIERLTIL
jgi:DNA-binding LytR/AlgR family response regulator